MEKLTTLFLTLCILFAEIDGQVSISGVRLTKYTRERSSLNLGDEDLSYVLECDYKAPAGSVTFIAWNLKGYEHYVYLWDAATNRVDVEEPLLGHVVTDTESTRIGPNIHFKQPSILMRGIYTCIVFHNLEEEKTNPVIYEFDLQMYYFDNSPFSMTASLEGCHVLLNYTSNYLYPKPEVSCGFWNATAHRVIRTIPGGVVFRQRVDGLYHIFMKETPIEVNDVPRHSLFFCELNLPIANYTHRMILEDNGENRDIYEAINARGCPADVTVDPIMEVNFVNCKWNCRNECQLSSSYKPTIQFECPDKHYAYWPTNRSSSRDWNLAANCHSTEHTWFAQTYKALNFSHMPICLHSGSERHDFSSILLTLSCLFGIKLIV